MRGEVLEERPLIFRQPEEMVLLPDPLRDGERVQGTTASSTRSLSCLNASAANAALTFRIHALVDIAGFIDPARQLSDAVPVPWLRRPDEIIERNVHAPPRLSEHQLHLVTVLQRIETLLRGLPEDVLRVFVIAHQEPCVDSTEPLVPGDDVGDDFLVRGAEVRTAVDVVNRRRNVETAHERGTCGIFCAP